MKKQFQRIAKPLLQAYTLATRIENVKAMITAANADWVY